MVDLLGQPHANPAQRAPENRLHHRPQHREAEEVGSIVGIKVLERTGQGQGARQPFRLGWDVHQQQASAQDNGPDEPTTALDVTIQAQILHLMNNLKEEHGTAIMFITHDLGVINQMADDVAVMYCGQVVEHVPARVLFSKSAKYSHPYTEGLMASVPRLDTKADRLDAIPGAVPHPLDLPKGCKFAPRCKYCTKRCMEEEPELLKVGENQEVRCFYPEKEARHAK